MLKKLSANHSIWAFALIAIVSITTIMFGCSNSDDSILTENGESGEHGEGGHGAEGSESGEESGAQLSLADTYDHIRGGARLILNYDQQSNSFKGTVENTTNQTLKRVRVEIHLSNGTELGPTTPVDLAPGQKIDVEMAATKASFTGWTPHAEVG